MAPSSATGKKRVIFADFGISKYNTLAEQFQAGGIDVELMAEGKKFLSRIAEESFDLCVVNLLLSGSGPFEWIGTIRKTSKNHSIKIVVVTKQVQKSNIQNTLRAGADDFVGDAVDEENLRARILYHLTPKKVIESLRFDGTFALPVDTLPCLNLLLQSTEKLAATAADGVSSVMYEILSQLALQLGSNRTSLMVVDEENDNGVILASSDDPKFCDFSTRLTKYPEALDVIHSGKFVLIEDVSKNQLTEQIRDTVRSISIGSMMVFPVWYAAEVVGVLTVRRPKASDLPSMDQLRLVQALANTLAGHAKIKVALRRIYKDFKPKAA